MDKDMHETFEEMIGPIGSPIERLRLKAAYRIGRQIDKLRRSTAKRAPFLLPVRGPLSGLDGGMRVGVFVLSKEPLVIYTPVEFDAVYTGRISPGKRHHLALDVERLVHITVSIGELPPAAARAFIRRLQDRSPLHRIANPIVGGLTAGLPPEEVNRVYNRAAVGLCLSAAEGAMCSSMEYLLAGLPVVSTPSLGGRDVFSDPDYCMIAEPDPAAIRRAVETLRDRRIPRDEIRARTLEKVRPQREELMAFLSDLLRRAGSTEPPLTRWPFRSPPAHDWWSTARRHARALLAPAPSGDGA